MPAPDEPIFVYCRLYELVPEPLLSELRSWVLSVIQFERVPRSRCVLSKLIYNLTQFPWETLLNIGYPNVNLYYRDS